MLDSVAFYITDVHIKTCSKSLRSETTGKTRNKRQSLYVVSSKRIFFSFSSKLFTWIIIIFLFSNDNQHIFLLWHKKSQPTINKWMKITNLCCCFRYLYYVIVIKRPANLTWTIFFHCSVLLLFISHSNRHFFFIHLVSEACR